MKTLKQLIEEKGWDDVDAAWAVAEALLAELVLEKQILDRQASLAEGNSYYEEGWNSCVDAYEEKKKTLLS